LWGGFAVGGATLQRFFSLHFALPFILLGVVVFHLFALHMWGSSNPLGGGQKLDGVLFTPYYMVKDFYGFNVFLGCIIFLVFFAPNFLGHPDNYIMANPLSTPTHIVPEWYFLPFYAILRSIPNKLLGVIALFMVFVVLASLPFMASLSTNVFVATTRLRLFQNIVLVRTAIFSPVRRTLFSFFVLIALLLG